MMRRVIPIVLIAIACTVAWGCAKHSKSASRSRPGSDDRPSTPPELVVPVDVVVYHRTGGFIGTDDTVTIWPNGRFRMSGHLMPTVERNLAATQLSPLCESLRCWGKVCGAERSARMDLFHHTIVYNGKSVSADDVNMSLEMRRIVNCIDAIRMAPVVNPQ